MPGAITPARCGKMSAYVMKHLGSVEKRAVELEDSYHVITVDSDKERIVDEVTDLRRAIPHRPANARRRLESRVAPFGFCAA